MIVSVSSGQHRTQQGKIVLRAATVLFFEDPCVLISSAIRSVLIHVLLSYQHKQCFSHWVDPTETYNFPKLMKFVRKVCVFR